MNSFDDFMTDDEFFEALQAEYLHLREQEDNRAFVLNLPKAMIVKNLCENIQQLFDDCGAVYTIEMRKSDTVFIANVAVSIVVEFDIFAVEFGSMELFRGVINSADNFYCNGYHGNTIMTFDVNDVLLRIER